MIKDQGKKCQICLDFFMYHALRFRKKIGNSTWDGIGKKKYSLERQKKHDFLRTCP